MQSHGSYIDAVSARHLQEPVERRWNITSPGFALPRKMRSRRSEGVIDGNGGKIFLMDSDLKAIIDSIHLITVHLFLWEKQLWDFLFHMKGWLKMAGSVHNYSHERAAVKRAGHSRSKPCPCRPFCAC